MKKAEKGEREKREREDKSDWARQKEPSRRKCTHMLTVLTVYCKKPGGSFLDLVCIPLIPLQGICRRTVSRHLYNSSFQ